MSGRVLSTSQQLYLGDKLMFDPLSLNDFPEMAPGARCDVRVAVAATDE